MLITKEEVIKAVGLNRFGLTWLANPLMSLFKIRKVNESYEAVKHFEDERFFEQLLKRWNIRVELTEGWKEKLPASGPIIFIANHPHGALDGIVLFKALLEFRKDFVFMGNFLLSKIKEIEHLLIPVNPLQKHKKAYNNLSGLRAALKHISDGKSLGIFPAVGMSSFRWKTWLNDDPEWSLSAIKLIRKTNCPIVPLFIHGSNSWRFHLASFVSRELTLVQQIPETFRKSGSIIKISVGEAFEWPEDQQNKNPEVARKILRNLVYSQRT